VIGLSNFDSPFHIIRMLDAGARGYIHKGAKPEELLMAIKTVLNNGVYLSKGLIA